jgi:hypothetical protein
MVNTTQFYKTKIALAVVLSIGLSACGDSEGDAGSTSTSASTTTSDANQNTVDNQDELTGTVQGVVVDSNANPLAGVMVYLGAQETVTNAGGQYVFTDVAVTNVSGVNNEGNETANGLASTLVVTIGGTDEFLGALVTVTPQAQVNNTGGQGAVTGGNGASGSDGATCTPGAGGSTTSTDESTTTDSTTALTTTVTVTTTNTLVTGSVPPIYDVTEETETVVTDGGGSVVSESKVTTSSVGDGGSCTAGSGGSGGAGGNASNGSNSDTTIQTFIDGFTAEAGIAVLPMLNAGAYGYIRDCRTGQPLAETTNVLSLDFVATSSDVSTIIPGNGTQLTNSEHTATISADADGKFSLANLAANSTYTISAKEGWFITGSPTVSTASEGSSEFLGTIEACPVSFIDTDLTPGAPYIKSVAGSIGETTGADNTNFEYEVLSKGIDGTDGITLNFSEAISAADVDVADIVVTLAGNAEDTTQTTVEVASATLADDGKSLTVVLAEALGDEQRFSIWFPQHQYVDNKENAIVTGDTSAATDPVTPLDSVETSMSTTADAEDDLVIDTLFGDGPGSVELGIASDLFSQETGKVGYIRTRLCTYIAPPETPEGLTGEQLVKTLDAALLAVSPLWDNSGDTVDTTASNLNGQEDVLANRDTGERLQNRFGGTVTNDTAVIVGTVENATGISGAVVAGTGIGTVAATTLAADNSYRMPVTVTSHGTQVVVTPTGAFGVTGTPVTVTLEDKVAPTTILQENYELWAVESDYSGTTFDLGTGAVGGGGEVTEGVITGADGDPLIYIQQRHLSPTGADNRADRYEEFDAFAFATDLTILGDANPNPLYSAPGFAGWDERGNSLGVAFSETIATGAVAPLQSASVTVALTGVLNGLTTDVDGNLIVGVPDTANSGATTIPNTNEDLARFTVSDMVDYANNDHDEAIDFTNGSIVDTQGNLANANSAARVVIRDAMPAFVTAASWDGSNLVITFNETVVPDGDGAVKDTLVLTNLDDTTDDLDLELNDTLDFPVQGAYSLNTAGDELTVAVDASNISGLFQNGSNDVFLFDSDGDTVAENHLALNFDVIKDARGNSWETFDRDENPAFTVDAVAGGGDDRIGRYLVDAPRFMLHNDVGIFTITKQTLGYDDDVSPGTDDDGVVTVRFTFSHPIDLLDDNDSVNVGDQRSAFRLLLDGAQVADYSGSTTLTLDQANEIFQFDLDGPAFGNPAANFLNVGLGFEAAFSTDFKTIQVIMAETANTVIAGTSQVIFQSQIDSVITDEFLNNETYTVVNSN